MSDDLPFRYLDALNMMRHYGGITRYDLYLMSISSSVVRDLVDEGLCRSSWISWEITRRGRRALDEAGIESFWDTRR